MKVISCAMRGRGKNGYTQMLELGCDIANCITSVAKDSLILEYEETTI